MLAQAPRPPAAAAAAPPPARAIQNIAGRPPSRPGNSGPANFRPGNSRPANSRPGNSEPSSRSPSSRPPSSNGRGKPAGPRKDAEHEILFQEYFKSVNPQRTYAAQVKKAGNGNHYVVFTEGRRDDATGEVRKTRLFVYSEDFIEFFRMLQETAHFVKANPVPEEVSKKRQQFWSRRGEQPKAARGTSTAPPPATKPALTPAPANARPPAPVTPAAKPRAS